MSLLGILFVLAGVAAIVVLLLGMFLDSLEPVMTWLIRLSGWSAIFFVFCIFVFIFKEGGPFLTNTIDAKYAEREYRANTDADPVKLPTVEFWELPYETVVDRMLEVLADEGAEKIDGYRDSSVEIEAGSVVTVVYFDPGTDLEKAYGQIQEVFPIREDKSHVGKFFTGAEWTPESERERQFGIRNIVVGTLSVTLLAILFAVPFSLGAAILHLRVLYRQAARDSEGSDRAAGGDPVGGLGLHWIYDSERCHPEALQP